MALPSRRAVLRDGGVFATACLSGCLSAFRNGPEGSRVSIIEIHNNTGEKQSVSITIREGNEIVYEEIVMVSPTKSDGPSISYAPDLPAEPGLYSVDFDTDRHRDDEQGEYHEQIGETSVECRGYILSIRPEDGGSKLVVHSLNQCEGNIQDEGNPDG